MLNLVSRWILSPLECCPSPMVEDWQACAIANGCAPEQVEQVCAKAEEFWPSYLLPVCRQYSAGRPWDAPFLGNGFALVYCEMDITHLQAAQKDTRLTIFASLDDAVDQAAVDAHSHLFDHTIKHGKNAPGAPQPSTLRELLTELSARHVKFSSTH